MKFNVKSGSWTLLFCYFPIVSLMLMNHSCSQIAGNQTIERLQHIFASSSQTYGGLTLDLHCNRFGPTALFQVLCQSQKPIYQSETICYSCHPLGV
jgi:hypothetical protein